MCRLVPVVCRRQCELWTRSDVHVRDVFNMDMAWEDYLTVVAAQLGQGVQNVNGTRH